MDELLELLALLARLDELDTAESERMWELLLAESTITADTLTAADDDQLAALDAGLIAAFSAERASDAPDLARLRAIADEGGYADLVRAEDARREEEAQQTQAEIDALAQRITATDATAEGGDAEGGEGGEAQPAETQVEVEVEVTPPEGGDGGEGGGQEQEQPEAVAAAATARTATRRRAPLGRVRQQMPVDRQARIAPSQARARIIGPNGAELSNVGEIGRYIVDAAEHQLGIMGGFSGRVPIVRIEGDYPAERQLGPDRERNAELIQQVVGAEALTAAGGLCAPLEPYRGVAQVATASRPVKGGLAQFRATRGGITGIRPPTMADVAAGVTEWTLEDDVNALTDDTVVKPAVRVECGEEWTARIRAIVERAIFGNITAMTDPERVRAIGELLAAMGARLGEQLLLDDIKDGSTEVSTGAALGMVRDLLYAVGVGASAYRNRLRMDPNANLRVLMPRWAVDGIREDIARSLPSTMDQLAVADDAIRGYFRARKVTVTEYIDSSTDGNQLFPGQNAGGTLLDFPGSVEWALFHEGAWLALDMGRLDLGIVRDSTRNDTNDYETFVEVFEAAARVGLDSYWVTSEVCPNGASAGTVDPSALCAGQYVPSV